MKGIKAHTHKYREKVVKEMIPLIKKKFGRNLVALAAQGSFARGDDHKFSDLELITFLRKVPGNKKFGGMGKIRDGMLVEIVWTTKKNYLAEVKEPNEWWFISGSDYLKPIINQKYITKLNNYVVKNLQKKCLNAAAKLFYEVAEDTMKVLNAIDKNNRKGIPLLLFDMFHYMLKNLSFLNKIPFTTFAEFVSEAEKLELKPPSFQKIIDIITSGDYHDLPRLEKIVKQNFHEFEMIYEELGIDLYYDEVDPNKPMKNFVKFLN